MPTLLIDTATDHVVVALADDGGRLLDASIEAGRAQSLPVRVAELLDRAGIAPGALTRIGVGIGPGAFTGLRIGVAFARGLASALECDLVPMSTMTAVAMSAIDHPGPPVATAYAALDARRGEWFLAEVPYVVEGDERRARLGRDVPYSIVTLAELEELGETAPVFRGPPDPAHLAVLALGYPPAAPVEVLPDYGREPDAIPGAFA